MTARMIRLSAIAVIALASAPAWGQIETMGQNLELPDASPKATVSQTIGISTVTIEYHRPGVKGREIFGGLLEYNEGQPYPWRAGANENTTIAFSHDAEINGQPIGAGTYGFHIALAEDEWTLIFSNNHTSWGSYFYNPDEDALRIKAEPKAVDKVEWLQYSFEDLTEDSATVYLRWADKEVSFDVSVDVHEIVLSNIRDQLRNIAAFTWNGWYQAANYCNENDVNLEEGLEWANQSIQRQKNEHNLRLKGQLLAKLDRTDDAKAAYENALEFADENEKEQIQKLMEEL